MNSSKLFGVYCVAMVMFGAGCASNAVPVTNTPVAAPSDQANTPVTVATPPTATTSSDSSVTTTSMLKDEASLAFPGVLPDAEVSNKFVHIKTNKGNIVFELLPKEGPKAASNFVYLAKQKFYDGLTFHRVVPGFVIQGGDPDGNGTGGPGYSFEDDKVSLPYKKGIVAMANAGPNTNGSQFFIMLEDNPLPPAYSIFGRVVSGQEVVDKIVVGDQMQEVTVTAKK